MSIQNLLTRYLLAARAQGESEDTFKHNRRVVGYFDDFMDGISDVTKVKGDDPAQLKYPLLYEN